MPLPLEGVVREVVGMDISAGGAIVMAAYVGQWRMVRFVCSSQNCVWLRLFAR